MFDRWTVAPRRSAALKLMSGSLVLVGLLASTGVVYFTGGTEGRFHALAHVYYLPIVIAALAFGPVAGITTGLAAAVLGGPLMPSDATLQMMQPFSDWLTRAFFFILIGGTVGGLTGRLRNALQAERQRRQQLNTLHEIDRAILGDQSRDVTFGRVVEVVASSFEAEACCLYLGDEKARRRLTLGACWSRSEVEREGFLALGSAVEVIQKRRGIEPRNGSYPGLVTCSDLHDDDCVPRSSQSEFEGLGLRSIILAPVINAGRQVGILLVGFAEPRQFSQDDRMDLRRVVHQVAIATNTARQRAQLRHFGDEALAAFTEAIAQRDMYTGQHVGRIVVHAVAVAERLGVSDDVIEAIRYGAQLHDIGKIAIPTDILRKPGSLSRQEWQIIKKHPVIGSQILERVSLLRDVVPFVQHHHEHYDGTGYPAGLRGEEIPLGARIIAVVDAFDAMTSDRPYRRALSYDEAIDELRTHAGSQFDPKVVSTFLEIVGSNGKAEIATNGALSRSLVSANYAPVANVVDYRRQRDVNVE